MLNVSNPKVFLFFVALFPTFLWGGQEDTVLQFYALGAIFMTATAVVFAGIAFLAATLGHFLATKSKFWLRFHYFQIALFIGLAIYIFLPWGFNIYHKQRILYLLYFCIFTYAFGKNYWVP